MDDLRYPVGEFRFPDSVSAQELATFIDQIAETPARMRAAVAGLSDSQLDTPYRPGGWTVRQLAHHVPDSHMNSYVRFRLALTEDDPVIKPYEEAAGPSFPTLAACRWNHRSRCSNRCTRAGCRCCGRSRLPTGNAAFAIPNWARSDWNRMPRSTPGTAAITWRTSPRLRERMGW